MLDYRRVVYIVYDLDISKECSVFMDIPSVWIMMIPKYWSMKWGKDGTQNRDFPLLDLANSVQRWSINNPNQLSPWGCISVSRGLISC